MNVIAGIVIVLACVAGGFVLSKGNLLALWQPYELLIIAGAAIGAFVISNPIKVVKAVLRNLLSVFKGAPYGREQYMDMLALMFDILSKARKDGLIALENDIENPESSPIFSRYPKILADHHAMEFICDYLRLMVGGNMNAFEIENLMDVEIESHHHEVSLPAHALTRVADGLPGFGIVAAVLGIVITMASLGGPPHELGHHVAAALVGTFLGILLAYGFVGPLSIFLEHRAREESQYFIAMKTCLLASLQGYAPQVAVEFGRKAIFPEERPNFRELEERVKAG
jgi:chemotaxis protein MotA